MRQQSSHVQLGHGQQPHGDQPCLHNGSASSDLYVAVAVRLYSPSHRQGGLTASLWMEFTGALIKLQQCLHVCIWECASAASHPSFEWC